jgi:two-component system chemotaxis response regulator CheB
MHSTAVPSEEVIMNKPIRVIVADDSPFICRLLSRYLESDADIRVIRTVRNGEEAWNAVRTLEPDVLTLDLDMPGLGGLDALQRIMADCPTAVVLISGAGTKAKKMAQRGLSLGAVGTVLKYRSGEIIRPDTMRREIVAKVKAAAGIRRIRSIPSLETRLERVSSMGMVDDQESDRLVVVGASTGGPLALRELLASLRMEFPFALLIVQHMPEGFTTTLARQFNRLFPFPVREAIHGELMTPGTVLVAPGDKHLLVEEGGRVNLEMAPRVNGYRPSIDLTMESAAKVFRRDTTGVLLSGMGNDGSRGLMAIEMRGGDTFAQSSESCVVETMPGTAIKGGFIQRVGTPTEIGRWLAQKRPHQPKDRGGTRCWFFSG